MTFEEILDQAIAMLQRRGRLTYSTLKRQFQLDDAALEDVKSELIYGQHLAVDEDERVLVWRGGPVSAPPSTPAYLAEKILLSRSVLEGERKQVAVLFADLKGSMELLADRDPEEARQLLDPVLECMIEAVHRYEGTVNQVMGDGIMALFGAPIAHEDHAVRACYAALRMQETVTHYGDAMQRSHGVPVQIRVGLNSGEVVVRAIDSSLHMDYTAVGQTTHLAARLEQMAKPGSVLTAGETLRLAAGFVQVTALGPVAVKGLADLVEVFELVGASSTRTRLQAFAARGLTRFVGRQAEFETVRQLLERAGTSHGQVVAVIGEPGVGKTRLVYEFIRSHHTRDWLVLESSSVSYGKATAYLPVRDLLKAYFHIDDRDDGRKIREKLTGKLLTLDATLGLTLPAFLALLNVPVEDRHWQDPDPTQRRQHTLAAIKQLLLRESQVQPLLLVFENLHWIDAETQAVLDSLIDSLPTARLLLLVNYRPEYQHGWGNKTYYTQLRLDPLPTASAEELLQALLGDEPSLVPLKRLLIERTEGNPFFLEESVRALVETGVLVGERGAYRPLQPLDSLQVPATVQAVLAARIDRLPPEEKRLLQTAAVIGTEVPFALLQAIGALHEEELRRGLSYLQAAEFLYETSLFPELEYTFKHALTHEVAYGSLLHERRRALHASIVAASERLYVDRLPERGELLRERFGLSVLPAVGSRHWLAWCLAELGAFPEGTAYREEAVRIAEAVDHPHTLIHAYLGVGFLSLCTRDLSRAIPVLERCLGLCRVYNSLLWFPGTASALGCAYAFAGRVAEAFLPLLEQAEQRSAAMGTMGGQSLRVGYLSEAYLLAGRMQEAVQLAGRALDLSRAHKERGHEAWTLRLLGEIAAQHDPPEVEPAEAHYRQALALADELGMRPLVAHCHLGLGTLYARTGQRQQASAELSTAIEMYSAMAMTCWLPQAEVALAQVEER